ncbi:MAG: hypothetical protein E5W45_01425 [Mesorhizobium sp.]|nr:MAG: hypothetical protein E5W45_01425 [Mesorhizobium sp.]
MSIFCATNRTATMHEDEGSTPEKLQAMLDVIARNGPSRHSEQADIGKLKADAATAAAVLVEFYGDTAPDCSNVARRSRISPAW